MSLQTFRYNVLIQRLTTIYSSVLLFLLIALAISLGAVRVSTFDTHLDRFNLFVTTLPYLVVIASTLLVPEAFKLDDIALLEVEASQPRPVWRNIVERVLINWIVINLSALLSFLVASILARQLLFDLLLVTTLGVAVLSVWCTGLILLGVTYSRSTRIGYIVGLGIFLVLFLAHLPENLLSVHPLRFQVVDLPSLHWWMSRTVYTGIGFGCLLLSLRLSQNTDYLLLGQREVRSTKIHSHSTTQACNRELYGLELTASLRRPMAIVFYEALVTIYHGVVPIVFLILGLAALVLMIDFASKFGFTPSAAYAMLSGFSPAGFLLPIFLPFIMLDTVAQDLRRETLEPALAVVSPRTYLALKILGVSLAIALSVIITIIVPTMLGVVLLLFNNPSYVGAFISAAFALTLLGLLPTAIYISSISILIGAIFIRVNPVVLKTLALVGGTSLFLLTTNSLVGNLIYVTGGLAYATISDWFSQSLNVNVIRVGASTETIVSFPVLLLPVASVLAQIIIVWIVTAKVFERIIRR